jgi:hypothetical protein
MLAGVWLAALARFIRLHRGTGVRLRPGILLGFTPERCSESSGNGVHIGPESPLGQP